ncbi:hypothetical protein ABU162_29860 [Paenibacillus thiaminolyticus]|uniref:hypothetical protein n=1 Tax=Paenibacillus thiaminolyticus TaxID=49283 RepID=UPI0035A67083
MENFKVLFLENTELAEYEAINKGYRNDIYVKISNMVYNIRAYDLVRLQQDFESELEEYGYFSIEPNLVLVKEVSKEYIYLTIKELFKQKYFEDLKPIEEPSVGNLFD